MSNLYDRYFIFSRTQMERINDANTKAGRPAPVFGTVIVNGIAKTYTDKIIDMNKAPFADSVIITQGDVRKIKFTQPEFT